MRSRTILLAALFAASSALAQQGDKAGCKDPALFPVRMPNYRIERCEAKPFHFYEFHTLKPPLRRIEGEYTFVQYTVDRSEDSRSGLEVVRNYENALKKIGGRVAASTDWWMNGVVVVGGREVWTEVQRGNSKIWIHIVRQQEMQQIVVADAAALSNDLKTIGHVTVHGIYFDTASATLKSESATAVGEIAKLLKGDPALKVYVVGHTDAVGSVESNLDLSQRRAQSVIAALTAQHGIPAARLRSFGNGPFAPVATNATEEGRAQNRRVELVRQ